MINAAGGRKPFGRGRSNFGQKQCAYRGKFGHTTKMCYKKGGYPCGSWFKGYFTANNITAEKNDTKIPNTDDTASVKGFPAKRQIACFHSRIIQGTFVKEY